MISALIFGGKSRCCSATCWIMWLLFFLLPHQTYPQSCSSSCGKIANITHPFRLKHDPDHCGDKRLEMDCVNNVAVLKFFSGEYYVQSINYHNYTIRLVDPNIQPSNCSSLPRFFLSPHNITVEENSIFRVRESEPIIYLNCTSPPSNDAYYVDTASCIDQHVYATPGDLKFGRLKPQCHVKLVTLASYQYLDNDNVTYIDIHRALSYGFELYWWRVYCTCQGYCYINGTSGGVVCSDDKCSYTFSASCGIWTMLKAIRGMIMGAEWSWKKTREKGEMGRRNVHPVKVAIGGTIVLDLPVIIGDRDWTGWHGGGKVKEKEEGKGKEREVEMEMET